MNIPQHVYISVTVEFSPEGLSRPLSLIWTDGRKYEIDKLVRVERRAASWGGGALRYEVMLGGQTRFLYRQGDRWFVEIPPR